MTAIRAGLAGLVLAAAVVARASAFTGLVVPQTPLLDLVGSAAAAYGTVKLSSAYAGPAIQMRVTIGGTATLKDIGFVNGLIDAATADSFAAEADPGTWPECRFYDQSGNGADTAFVAGHLGATWSPYAMAVGLRSCGFDKLNTNSNTSSTTYQALQLPNALVLDEDAFSAVFVGRIASAYPNEPTTPWELASTRVPWYFWSDNNAAPGPGVGNGVFFSAGSFTNAADNPTYGFSEAGPGVFGIAAGATSAAFFVDDATATLTKTSQSGRTSTGGFMGYSAGGAFFGGSDAVAVVFYARTLSPTEIAAVQEYGYQLTRHPELNSNILVGVGESVMEGYFLPYNETFLYQALPQINVPLRLWVDATGAMAANQHHPLIARDTALYRAGHDNVAVILAGYNDIEHGSTATQAAQNVLQLCTDMHDAGFKTVVMSSWAVTTSFLSSANQTTMNDYIEANWAASCDALADVWADPHIGAAGNPANTTYYTADGIHLVVAGHAIMAALVAAAVNAVLP